MSKNAGPIRFVDRHCGPSVQDVEQMLSIIGEPSLDSFIDKTVPDGIRLRRDFLVTPFAESQSEQEALARMAKVMGENNPIRSLIGLGYYDCYVPPVIQRNILENPGWYTQYTPYQPEISQGRLEALLNFQTLVSELTGLPIANASLLDEATAAAEAMHVAFQVHNGDAKTFFVSERCFPQTIDVMRTRGEALGVEILVGDESSAFHPAECFGVLLQYPDELGAIHDPRPTIEQAHTGDCLVIMACDPLSLLLLRSPGELGADIAVGSMQRFGVPLGFGGPHAAYFATKDEYKRNIPGRIVGVTKDGEGRLALRLALQTREQHIRRERATSNICTAQVLLSIMASMYAVWHGPRGLRAIADRVHSLAARFGRALTEKGFDVLSLSVFDTVTFRTENAARYVSEAENRGMNLRLVDGDTISVAFDETSDEELLMSLGRILSLSLGIQSGEETSIPTALQRTDVLLEQDVFNRYRSETEFLRYVKRLESRDLSLAVSMIPLGSCTMKLNATSEMLPVTWETTSRMHPFAPASQTRGYQKLFAELEQALADITGFPAVSLQPNAGSQGEYAGLLCIRRYHRSCGSGERKTCLIPRSAHGTNPASAVMAGFEVVVVDCDANGNVDFADLTAKAEKHAATLGALMVTYPSTHGVFESQISQVCDIVHHHGGLVYMDGANLNALVGLARPADFGADVVHINLHKTFCIPHGGGGPGMGPIGVREDLRQFLPGHVIRSVEGRTSHAVSAAPWGSASILPISWMYMALMGSRGLQHASKLAILNANYMAKRLASEFSVLFTGDHGYVAHECIIDFREFKQSAGVEVVDIAKRLMDYGFHSPTMSWPVPGTLMIEPTESESKEELDRFCDALLSIRQEIRLIESGRWPRDNNPLKNAPHTMTAVVRDEWTHPYSRQLASFPAPWTESFKFWPSVGRVDESFGDKNFVCTCPSVEDFRA